MRRHFPSIRCRPNHPMGGASLSDSGPNPKVVVRYPRYGQPSLLAVPMAGMWFRRRGARPLTLRARGLLRCLSGRGQPPCPPPSLGNTRRRGLDRISPFAGRFRCASIRCLSAGLEEGLKGGSFQEAQTSGISGGETGIRTLGTLSRTHAFQACALSRSAISPAQDLPRWGPATVGGRSIPPRAPYANPKRTRPGFYRLSSRVISSIPFTVSGYIRPSIRSLTMLMERTCPQLCFGVGFNHAACR
ncbi:MAG: hypothetical protein QOD93_2291 [Acetobacteraceae bacterium]|jgi:hypothetical protein|nr:hypothetical protein [Acetobacteraceae bacterium]MEA2769329.1 hypothetical protein [Acetobacteraceae bacterium]